MVEQGGSKKSGLGGGDVIGGVEFTPFMRIIHTEKRAGVDLRGSELGYTVGWWRGVWGVQGWGMMYFGSGTAVV